MSAFLEVHLTFADPEPGREIAVALLAEAGCTMFREDGNELWAYAAAGEADLEAVEQVQSDLTPLGMLAWEVNEVQGENWNARWEAEYAPVEFSRRATIRAPFHAAPAEGIDVIIRPEMSFGTGHHPTTRLMVEVLLDHPPTGERVLDMGAGTGVLAIAAVRLGARACLAVEIEPGAADNARENAIANGLEQAIEVRCGDASVLRPEDGKFHRVLANINRNVLQADWPVYNQAAEYEIVTSGFFPSDVPLLAACAAGWNWEPLEVRTHEGWACVRWKRIDP
jgi:ribosomal protein L11 methyltransferase